MTHKWITPFWKQCFVVFGTVINTSQIAMAVSVNADLLQELRGPDSLIPLNDDTASWVASLPAFTMIIGNFIIAPLMAKLGRKPSTIISVVIILLGWICLFFANNLKMLLIGRFIKGISCGMTFGLATVVIGECTSPKNRGAFSTMISFSLITGTFVVHTLVAYLSWKTTSFVCALIAAFNLLIVILSPESPSWLADRGKFEESKKVFRWLRGDGEDDELIKMIEACKLKLENEAEKANSFKRKFKEFIIDFRKKEYYVPIIIAGHLHVMTHWAGSNIVGPYINDLITITSGENVNMAAVIICTDLSRILGSIFAVYIVKKLKRRQMLFGICGLNTIIFLTTAGYVYCKQHNLLYVDHPAIGITLLELLGITISTGSLPVPAAITAEIFPLKYRSLSSGFTTLFISINIFLCIKTFNFLINSVGLSGAYCVYGGIIFYCLVVVWFLLPETKDKTLQEIEESFKGKVSDSDFKAAIPLKNYDVNDS